MAKSGFHGTIRQSMSWLHTWAGLVLSILLYFIFVTGTIGYFVEEIDLWMQPEAPAKHSPKPIEELFEGALGFLEEEFPDAKNYYVTLPEKREAGLLSVSATLKEPLPNGERYIETRLDPANFAEAKLRETGGAEAIYVMHYQLHYMPQIIATYLVGLATLFMLLSMVTGIVVHKKIFADFFTLRLGKGQRSWLDAHNMASVLALPFMLMITYSGLLFFQFNYLPGVAALGIGIDAEAQAEMREHLLPSVALPEPTGEPGAMASLKGPLSYARARWGEGQISYIGLDHPGDRNAVLTVGRTWNGLVRHTDYVSYLAADGSLIGPNPPKPLNSAIDNAMLAAHEGRFADYPLRWLYFISGLLGCGMIATGLILWTSKRRSRLNDTKAPPASLKFVEKTNVAIIAGLPIGVVALLWANRLLPLDTPDRAEMELHALFLVWALTFVHCSVRSTLDAWREQITVLAAMSLSLPLLNAITTDVHLGTTVRSGDWARASVDLFMLVFGVAMVLVVRKLPSSPLFQHAPKRARVANRSGSATTRKAGEHTA